MRILAYIEGRRGLGHLRRMRNIINSIFSIDKSIEFIIITNSNDRGILNHQSVKLILEERLSDSYIAGDGVLAPEFAEIFMPFAKRANPDMIISDSFYSPEVLKAYRHIPRILILRKTYDQDMEGFFRRGHDALFSLIIIPHNVEELIDVHIPRKRKIHLTGPILPEYVNSLEKEKGLIMATVGGGGFPDAQSFLKIAGNAFMLVNQAIPGCRFIMQTGPCYNGDIKRYPFIEYFGFRNDFLDIIAKADVIVSQAGYNTLNEIRMLGKTSIIIPSKKLNDDQEERARFFERYGFKRFDSDDPEKLAGTIMSNLGSDTAIFEAPITDNDKAARIILDYLYEDRIYNLAVGVVCNNNCTFCKDARIKAPEDKTLDQIEEELESAMDKGYLRIRLPCNAEIRKDYLEIVRIASDLGLLIWQMTNCRMFSYESFAEHVLPYISGFEILSFNEENYAYLTGTQSYKQYIKGKEVIQRSRVPDFVLIFEDSFTGNIFDNIHSNISLLLPTYPSSRYTDNYNQLIEVPENGILPAKTFSFLNKAELPSKGRYIDWAITKACNYNCRYCQAHSSLSEEIGIGQVEEKIRFFRNLKDTWNILIAGGEPLLLRDIEEMMTRLIEYTPHSYTFVTNMHNRTRLLSLLRIIGLRLMPYLYVSLHPESCNWKVFLEDCYSIKEELDKHKKGLVVNAVAVPEKLEKLEKIGKVFCSKGILFNLQPMIENRRFVRYDDKQKSIIRSFGRSFGLENINFLGHMCSSGRDYITIDSGGFVYRCMTSCRYRGKIRNDCIGNIHEGKVSLGRHSHPCPYPYCICISAYENRMIEGINNN